MADLQSATIFSLPELIDLALSGPEVGVVNFNLLQYLLHIIVEQLDIADVKVEFKGAESEKLQKLLDPNKKLNVASTKYVVTAESSKIGKGQPIAREGRKFLMQEELVETEIKVIDRRKDSKEPPDPNPVPLMPPPGEGAFDTVVVVPTNGTDNNIQTPVFTVAITTEVIQHMMDEIKTLTQKMGALTDLPTNQGLINAVRRSSKEGDNTPVVDMYQILSLTKRIDAAEEGMAKLASMIEDLAREHQQLSGGSPRKEVGTDEIPKSAQVTAPVPQSPVEGTNLSTMATNEAISLIQKELQNLRNVIQVLDVPGLHKQIEEMKNISSGGGPAESGGDISGRMTKIELKFNECLDQVSAMDGIYSNQFCTIVNQVTDIEKELGALVQKGLGEGDNATAENVLHLSKKFIELETDLIGIADTAKRLVEEKDERDSHIAAVLEQIEMLKTIKADKEDLESQMADKVDTCMINRKVSLAQFDATCEDLSKGIEDALDKLTRQEEMWQCALEEIQNTVGNKLDKMELGPLRDFVTNKLRALQGKFKMLSNLKKEQEAAGTKSKLLRDVKCISCDKDVVMRKTVDPSLYAGAPQLAPSKNLAPYLAYELDQLRKQQKSLSMSKNLNHFEMATSKSKDRKGKDLYVNRYCGGSHTMTTPQQRVTRMGNFLEQWTPELMAATETDIKGRDGQYYKGEDNLAHKSPRYGKPAPPILVQGDILAERDEEIEGLKKEKRASSLRSLKTDIPTEPTSK